MSPRPTSSTLHRPLVAVAAVLALASLTALIPPAAQAAVPARPGPSAAAAAGPTTRYLVSLRSTAQPDPVAAAVGAEVETSLAAVHTFVADLTSPQAARLAARADVAAVTADTVIPAVSRPHTSLTERLAAGPASGGGAGETGQDALVRQVWDAVGGPEQAGHGVVVGEVGWGLSPDGPAFEGAPLTREVSDTQPYLADDGGIVAPKADGTAFHGICQTGSSGDELLAWKETDCTTKVVGARYFRDGFVYEHGDAGRSRDQISPRDAYGWGSHDASVAAGAAHVSVSRPSGDPATFSGVAPAAMVAAYKACWLGDSDFQDGCTMSDVVAAINQAVTDGVDVIDLGAVDVRKQDDSTVTALDWTMLGASAAGVFVATASGDSRPEQRGNGVGDVGGPMPYVTTVGNAELPGRGVTLQLGAGGSGRNVAARTSSVPTSALDLRLVRGDDARDDGWDAPSALGCDDYSLDPAKVAGRLVYCENLLSNTIQDMAQEVHDAGGAALVVPEAFLERYVVLDAAVPVFIVSEADGVRVAAAASATTTVRIDPEDTVTPLPRVDVWSNRGPVPGGTSSALKPDLVAPGVDALGAVSSWRQGDSLVSGAAYGTSTTTATSFVAGLAAVYLGERPAATPAEVKSALMTTAGDTLAEDGSPLGDPFTQGAGVIHAAFLHPGLAFLNGVGDWLDYLHSQDPQSAPTAPPAWTLNQPAIVVPAARGPVTVTRTVTSLGAGSWTAEVTGMAGTKVSVEPSTLSFSGAGETATYTVTLAGARRFDGYTSGFLTWRGDGADVRTVLAYDAAGSAGPASVPGTGVDGSTSFDVTNGAAGAPAVSAAGLVKATRVPNDGTGTDHSHTGGRLNTRDGHDTTSHRFPVTVPSGTRLLHVAADLVPYASDRAPEMSTWVWRLDENGAPVGDYQGVWLTQPHEIVDLVDPEPGNYEIVVVLSEGKLDFDLSYATLPGHAEGGLTARSDHAVGSDPAGTSRVTATWKGLDAKRAYVGAVDYGEGAGMTVLEVSSGTGRAILNRARPRITGVPAPGRTLTATSGSWSAAGLTLGYQWTADGRTITGATGATYRIPASLVGHRVGVTVSASARSFAPARVRSAEVAVRYTSAVRLKVTRLARRRARVKVIVAAPVVATGVVTVRLGKQHRTARLVHGSATVRFTKVRKGRVTTTYAGSATLAPATGSARLR